MESLKSPENLASQSTPQIGGGNVGGGGPPLHLEMLRSLSRFEPSPPTREGRRGMLEKWSRGNLN